MNSGRSVPAACVACVILAAITMAPIAGERTAAARPESALGACCTPDFICVLLSSQQECTFFEGTWQGDGTTCGGNCGACCLSGGGCTNSTSPDVCAGQAGDHQGEASTCGGVTCPTDPLGACCLPTANCLFGTESECITAAGIWAGEGTVCGDFNQNGTDDVCENPCPGDTNGDDVVDVIDLLALLGSWGPCN